MQIKPMDNSQWPAIQEIYKEAFPKSEQKPFFLLKRPVRSGKAQLWTAEEDEQLLGFLLADIWKDLVLVDYLAVSSKSRGKGTGSQLLHHVMEQYTGKRVLLLIERLDDKAENSRQRIARRSFYLRNGFDGAGFCVEIGGGQMEVLRWGGPVTAEEYLGIQRHAMGGLLYRLSHTRVLPAVT